MPILRTIKNYLKAYLAKGVIRFMSKESQIVYMVLNCSAKKIAPRVILPATDYVRKQISKQLQLKSYGKTWRGEFNNSMISVVESMVGAPGAAMTMEALKRAEVSWIVRVDYCGGLTEDIEVGDIVLCDSAICGDGTTPHYLNSSEKYPQVTADMDLTSLIERDLESKDIKFHKGPIWTHDALFVEPPELIEKAKKHGAIAIDMETSVVFALGNLFSIPTESILVVTDKPTGDGLKSEKITISPKIFQNLDKVIDRILKVLSTIP
jgi:uridine phosphorylase